MEVHETKADLVGEVSEVFNHLNIQEYTCVVLVIKLFARSLLIETGRGGIRLMIPGISFMLQ